MPKVEMKHYVCTECGGGKFCLFSTSTEIKPPSRCEPDITVKPCPNCNNTAVNKLDYPKMYCSRCGYTWARGIKTKFEGTDAEMIHFLVDSDKPLCPTPL